MDQVMNPKSLSRRVLWVLPIAGVGLVSTLWLFGCQLATPFAGPGYDPARGVTLPNAGDTVIVGVTHAVARPFDRAAFNDHTRRVIRSLPANDGFIGYSVRSRILGNEVWTMTVWRDEAALNAFVRSDTHRTAMRDGLSGVVRAKFLRVTWPAAAAPPSWEDILDRLEVIEYVEYQDRPPGGSVGRSGPRAHAPASSLP